MVVEVGSEKTGLSCIYRMYVVVDDGDERWFDARMLLYSCGVSRLIVLLLIIQKKIVPL